MAEQYCFILLQLVAHDIITLANPSLISHSWQMSFQLMLNRQGAFSWPIAILKIHPCTSNSVMVDGKLYLGGERERNLVMISIMLA